MSQLFKSRSSPVQQSESDLGEALRTAVIRNDTHPVKTILKKIGVDYILDANRKTALYLASQYGHQKLVKILLCFGANPNYRCIDGSTPVHAACYNGDQNIIKLLFEAGGDIRLHDNDGRGVRQWAMKNMDEKKCRAVLVFLEELYQHVMENNGDGGIESFHVSVQSRKAKRRRSTLPKGASGVRNIGFGTLSRLGDHLVSESSAIPVISELDLVHDRSGFSYGNGSFMIMESMRWNQIVPVTAKRLRALHATMEYGRVDELINENNYMLQLRHPNILLLLAVCPMDQFENLVLVYERVSNGSLHTLLHHEGCVFSMQIVCSIFMQLCHAVSYLHYKNLIHTSITPNAIQVMSSFRCIKLGNFEYMVDSGVNDSSVFVTRSYPVAMTNWLAPEIFTVKMVSKRSDIYGVCVVLWEVLHGEQPFDGLLASEIEFLLLEAPDRVLLIDKNIDVPFNAILDCGLKGNPSLRPHHIKDIQFILEEAKLSGSLNRDIWRSGKLTRSIPKDKQCGIGCTRLCDENGDLIEMPFHQNPGENKPVGERGKKRSQGQRKSREMEAPFDDDATANRDLGNASKETKRLRTKLTGKLLEKTKLTGKLLEMRPMHEENTNTGKDISNEIDPAYEEMKVSYEDVPLTASEVNVFEMGSGRWATFETDPSVTGLSVDASFKHTTGEDFDMEGTNYSFMQGDYENKASAFEGNSVFSRQTDSESGTTNVGDNTVGYEKMDQRNKETSDEAADERNVAGKDLQSSFKDEFTSEKETVKSFEKYLEHLNLQHEKAKAGGRANADRQQTTRDGFGHTDELRFLSPTADSPELMPSCPVSEEIIVPTVVPSKQMSSVLLADLEANSPGNPFVTSNNSPFGHFDGVDLESGKTGDGLGTTYPAVSLRRSIEVMKREFFLENSTSRKDFLSQSDAFEFLDGIRSGQNSPISAEESRSKLCETPKLSESMEQLKAFVNKPLPPLPHTYIRLSKAEKPVIVDRQEKELVSLDQSDLEQTTKITLRTKNSLEKPFVSTTVEPTTLSPGAEPALTLLWPKVLSRPILSIAPLRKNDTRAFDLRRSKCSGLSSVCSRRILQYMRAQNQQMSSKSSVPQSTSKTVAANLDFITGFKPASHHVPSMVAAHLTKRTNECTVAGVSLISPRSPEHVLWRQDDVLGKASRKFGREISLEGLGDEHAKAETTLPAASGGEFDFQEVHDTRLAAKSRHDIMEFQEMRSVANTENVPASYILDSDVMENPFISMRVYSKTLDLESLSNAAAVRSSELIRNKEDDVIHALDPDPKEVMGDQPLMESKVNDASSDADLEVHDTQRLEPYPPGVSPADDPRTALKVAMTDPGGSLTLPKSNRISKLVVEADAMHRFKSDPLLQKEAIGKRGAESAKKIISSDQSDKTLQQMSGSSRLAVSENDKEESDANETGASVEDDGDGTKIYKTTAHLFFQPRLPDTVVVVNKEQARSAMALAKDHLSCFVDDAIKVAVDEVKQEYAVCRCPHVNKSISAAEANAAS